MPIAKLKDLRKSFWQTQLSSSSSVRLDLILSGTVPFNGAPP